MESASQYRIFVAFLVLIFGWSVYGYPASLRIYSLIPIEEAQSLAKRITETGSPRNMAFYRWTLKGDLRSLYARGIKIDEQDHVIFAAAEKEVLRTEEGDYQIGYGMFYTTVDLQVVSESKNFIKKGGYAWVISSAGVEHLGDRTIFFKEPIKDFSTSLPSPKVELFVLPGESTGFIIRVAGENIHLK